MEGEFLYNNNIIIAMGVTALLAIIYGIYTINKKNPGMNPGEILSSLAVDQHETVFMAGIIGLGIADAVIVSSTHSAIANAIPMNPFGRIVLHLSAFLIETVASITLVRDVASCFMKQEWRWRSWKIATTLGILLAVFFIPLQTLNLAASNLGVDFEWDIYKYSIDPRTNTEEMNQIIQQYNLSPDGKPYRPFDHVPVPLKLLIFSALLRLLLLSIEGGRNVGSPTRSRILFERLEKEMAEEAKRAEESKKKKEEPKKEDNKDSENQVASNAKYILSRLGYDGPKQAEFVTKVEKALDKITPPAIQAGMAGRMAQFVTRGNQIKNMPTSDDKSEKNKKLRDDIKAFLSGPVNPNRPAGMKDDEYVAIKGLGLDIKK